MLRRYVLLAQPLFFFYASQSGNGYTAVTNGHFVARNIAG